MISYEKLHKIANRATPENYSNYKQAIQLHKLYNQIETSDDWISLNINQIITGRQKYFQIISTNISKIGFNTLSNRLVVLNGKIPLDWLSNTFEVFKLKCKALFLA